MLVAGSAQQLLIDPAPGVDGSVRADAVVISHAHEDHIAGLRYFSAPVYTHHRDVEAVASLEVLLDLYGLDPADRPEVARIIDEQFGLPSRHHGVQGVDDGEVLDLGIAPQRSSTYPGTRRDTAVCSSNPTASSMSPTSI